MAFLRHKTELNKDAMSSRETYPVATSAPYPTYLNALAKNGYVKAACVGPSHKMAYTLIADTGPIAPRPFSDGSILDPNLIPRWMKRVALMLMLSFLIIAAFDWMFVAALLARGAELAPDSQAVTIPSLAPTAAPTAAPDETSSQVLTIPLPETFAGCWSGDVKKLDSRKSYIWWRPSWLSIWFDKTYTICFSKRGLNQWEIGYGAASVDPSRVAMQMEPSHVLELGMSGPQSAMIYLTAEIRFGSRVETEETHLDCSIEDDGKMAVRARVDEFPGGNSFASRDEEMSGTWHAEFQPAAGGNGDGNGSVVGAPAR
jgi:hypothetical protein